MVTITYDITAGKLVITYVPGRSRWDAPDPAKVEYTILTRKMLQIHLERRICDTLLNKYALWYYPSNGVRIRTPDD